MADNNENKVILNSGAFPANNKGPKEGSRKDRPKPKTVAKARRVRKTFGQRVRSTFAPGETGNDIVNYILYDVIIPTAKNAFADLVEGSLDRALFGGNRRGKTIVRHGGQSFVSYSDIFPAASNARRPHDVEPAHLRRALSRHDTSAIILDSRQDAEAVLEEFTAIFNEYGMVTLADLYQLVGITATFTDANFGWLELPYASVSRVRQGYALDLPKPVDVT